MLHILISIDLLCVLYCILDSFSLWSAHCRGRYTKLWCNCNCNCRSKRDGKLRNMRTTWRKSFKWTKLWRRFTKKTNGQIFILVIVIIPSGRLLLLSARPTVTFPASEHHRHLANSKFYCLVTEAHGCEQLAQSRYLMMQLPRVEPATCRSQVRWPNHNIKLHQVSK